ncbi:carbohydrate ABC transporter permease [Paenibacillus sepulcri]|uniref:Carbohydrate ABC transporter permease n=1 Tax=Paenibacillus sepulcri TaxID=359917 RepID=A0ABS7BY77_9BACL|nr:carbohydrate ABC transporter permease [Paenibacillus sepulcri]
MVRSQTLSVRLVDAGILIFLAVVTLLSLYPTWYTVVLSFSEKASANAGLVRFFPVGFNLSSYQIVLGDEKFFTAFGVSVKRVLLGGAINFAVTVLMAYPLSKQPKLFPGRNIYMWFLVVCMLFTAGLIPLFIVVTTLGLQNSIWALVLPTAVPVLNVILVMNFFRSLPKELEEAAVVDGSGPWKTLILIYLPLALPSLATVSLFSIVNHWNAFLDGLIFMNRPEQYPLQTYIQQLVVRIDPELIKSLTTEQLIKVMNTSERTLNAAKLVVAMVPILIIYPFLQRYFVHGIVMGSVKE